MKKYINKKTLSEQALYFGEVKMPKGFEIERDQLVKEILTSDYYQNVNYHISKPWDKLVTYVREFLTYDQKFSIIDIGSYGSFFERNENSNMRLETDPMDLMHAPDFVLLYGVEIDPNTCSVDIHYDNNRVKGLVETVRLENNWFIMFPAHLKYTIFNEGNSYLNFIQTIKFDLVGRKYVNT